MKICYIANADSIHTQRWVKALSDFGYDLTVISPKSPTSSVLGNRVIDLSSKSNSGINYLRIATKIKSIVDRIKPDILHAHYATGYGFLGRICNYHPLIISVWGSDVFEFPNRSFLHKWLLSSNLNAADVIASTSHCMAKETRKYIDPRREIYITPFGIDLDLFAPKKTFNWAEDGELTIGTIKALEPIYGITNLVQAFVRISSKYPKLKLLIVGNGSERELLIETISTAGLSERAQVLSAVPHDQVPEYMSKIDIFVVPSRSESFGVAALEASASEIPVIASDVGGLPEVVLDGVTGYLVPVNNVESLAEKITQLIESPHLRLEMGENGRRFVEENYMWAESVNKMSDLYNKLYSIGLNQGNLKII
jgi:L-malate glycosyltransferase